MRDEKEERKKQARSNKQTRQSNTAHMYTVRWSDRDIIIHNVVRHVLPILSTAVYYSTTQCKHAVLNEQTGDSKEVRATVFTATAVDVH